MHDNNTPLRHSQWPGRWLAPSTDPDSPTAHCRRTDPSVPCWSPDPGASGEGTCEESSEQMQVLDDAQESGRQIDHEAV